MRLLRFVLVFTLFSITSGCAASPSMLLNRSDIQRTAEPVLRVQVPAGVHGLVQTPTGDILISDSFGNGGAGRTLYRWEAPHTGLPVALDLEGTIPSGMEWIDDHLYVCDAGLGTVSVLDSDLGFVRAYEVPAPWNLTQLEDGKVVVVNAHGSVYELREDGGAELVFGGLDAPFDILAADGESVWITEQGRGMGQVTRRTLDGRVLETLPGMDNPEGLLLDSTGALWIADTGTGKIFRKAFGKHEVTLITDSIALPIVGIETESGEILFNGAVGGLHGLYRVGMPTSIGAYSP